MILDIFGTCGAIWLFYIIVQGIQTGNLYARISASDENIYIKRKETPIKFWFFSVFYLGVVLLLIWSVFFAENAV